MWHGRNHQKDSEENLVDNIEEMTVLENLFFDLLPVLKKIIESDGVINAFREASKIGMLQMFNLAMNEKNPAIRLKAWKDILDRAGYKPVEKHQNININLPENMINAELESRLKNLTEEERKIFIKYVNEQESK